MRGRAHSQALHPQTSTPFPLLLTNVLLSVIVPVYPSAPRSSFFCPLCIVRPFVFIPFQAGANTAQPLMTGSNPLSSLNHHLPSIVMLKGHAYRTVPAEAHPRSVLAHRSVVRAADRKSTRLNSSHLGISYAVFCL